ncbi:patatin [filamentous cyanobacterium CCP5]|nr:patatin [filamentous cyanobacterium CCP5]
MPDLNLPLTRDLSMKPSVGLALGGGGARGWAHVGVIRALEEADIDISCVAGTSIGALVGAVYVAGSLERLEAFAEEVTLKELTGLLDISFPGSGLIDGDRIHDFIRQYLSDKTLEEATIPFQCVATNFLLKEEAVIQSGLMVDAVRASISMPGVFAPCKRAEHLYLVDGGVVNPVPVSTVKAMGAETIIAVNLNKEPKTKSSPRREDSGANAESASNSSENSDSSAQSNNSERQTSSGAFESLSNRYEDLKGILQDQVDDWIPDPQSGINIFDVLGNSINIMEQKVTEVNLRTGSGGSSNCVDPNLADSGNTLENQPEAAFPIQAKPADRLALTQLRRL